jgi:hypothetical protein
VNRDIDRMSWLLLVRVCSMIGLLGDSLLDDDLLEGSVNEMRF